MVIKFDIESFNITTSSLESGDIFSDADDKEDDGFDLKNWSPLREVYDSMPTFSVGV